MMEKNDILNLCNLSDKDQREWLIHNGVLAPLVATSVINGKTGYTVTAIVEARMNTESGTELTAAYESLADCAYRLRDRAIDTIKGKVAFLKNAHTLVNGSLCRWIFRAKPIHSIQAALLVLIDTPPLPPSHLCRIFHVQQCHICDDVKCGDNLTEKPL